MLIAPPYRFYLIACLCVSWACKSYCQDINSDIKTYIKAWKSTDEKQSRFYESTKKSGMYDMDMQPDPERFLNILKSTKRYISQRSDTRLELRVLLFEIDGAKILNLRLSPSDTLKLRNAIKMALLLKDEQILAETYQIVAWHYREKPEFLLYTMKALDLQEKIGPKRFPGYSSSLFNLSSALYFSQDYKESIHYGSKFLQYHLHTGEASNTDLTIYQLDLLGAAYLKLGRFEKVMQYYNRLLDVLKRQKGHREAHYRIWTGVAHVNKGLAFLRQGRESESDYYLKSALDSSLKAADHLNATKALDGLAQLKYQRAKYHEALVDWKKAIKWTYTRSGSIESQHNDRIQMTLRVSQVYQKLGQSDSAFWYFSLYSKEKERYDQDIRGKNLQFAKAKLDFDNINAHLLLSVQKLKNEKLLRNTILIGILLIGIILLFILNQRRLREARKQREIQARRELAELQVIEAKEHLEMFKQNLLEKERLIGALKAELEAGENQKSIQDHLFDYTLLTEEEWRRFKIDFTKAYPDFLGHLRKKIEDLSPAEERLSSLLLLNLSNAQIGKMLGIAEESVARSKRRLKSRISLPDQLSLEEYILAIDRF